MAGHIEILRRSWQVIPWLSPLVVIPQVLQSLEALVPIPSQGGVFRGRWWLEPSVEPHPVDRSSYVYIGNIYIYNRYLFQPGFAVFCWGMCFFAG